MKSPFYFELKCKIIDYPNSKHMTVEFENGKVMKDKTYRNFLKGHRLK